MVFFILGEYLILVLNYLLKQLTKKIRRDTTNQNNEFSILVWAFIVGFSEKFVPDSLFFIISRRLSK